MVVAALQLLWQHPEAEGYLRLVQLLVKAPPASLVLLAAPAVLQEVHARWVWGAGDLQLPATCFLLSGYCDTLSTWNIVSNII
jgi:hypothetical protein